MAGRIVVLRFDKKEDAEYFVDSAKEEMEVRGASFFAMFLLPNQFCECPDKTRQTVANWAKGSRTGIWICRRCKKPSQFHNRGLLTRLKYIFGNNLLEGPE